MQETLAQSLGQEILWRREWQPIPVFLPGKSHGQRNLAGYSPLGHKKSDTTEQLTHTHKLHGGQSGRYHIQPFNQKNSRENKLKKIKEETLEYTNAEERPKFTVKKSPPSVKRNGLKRTYLNSHCTISEYPT